MNQRQLLIVIAWMSFLMMSCVPSARHSGLRGSIRAESGDFIIYSPAKSETMADIARAFYGEPDKTWIIEDAAGDLGLDVRESLVVPLKPRHLGGLYNDGYQGVPILCYHQFGTGSSSSMNIPAPLFEKQMRYLKKNGYRVISPEELLGFLEYRRQIPKKSVMISVDDGYHSFYDVAYPVLKKYGFTAVLFIYTDYVGISGKALSWDELRELKSNGFIIGSHSVSHSDLTRAKPGETPGQSQERILDEIHRSKQILDKELNQNTWCFSFPFGRSDPEVVTLVKDAGYKLAFSVERGTNPFFSDPHVLRRDMVLKRDMKTFVSRLKTFNPVSLR